MCDYCEKMKPIMRTTFEDGTYLQATLCPIYFKDKGPYIYIEHTTPIEEHYKTSYADGMFINYCPICGRKLSEN